MTTLGCLVAGATNLLQIAQPVLALGAAEPEEAKTFYNTIFQLLCLFINVYLQSS